VCAKKCATHAEHALINVRTEHAPTKCLRMLSSEHAVKSYTFSNFLKQVKNIQRVKIKKKFFWKVANGFKRNFYFYLALEII
jgi:hypothetical protein